MDTTKDKNEAEVKEEEVPGAQTPLHDYAHKGKKIIGERISELSSEWDLERTFLLNAALVSLTGAVLGAFVNKKWLALSAFAAVVMAEQALTGWSPPAGIMKKLGKRTRDEITRERYGLKAMQGDFKKTKDAGEVWNATE